MPEATRVANWREKIASSRMSTLFQRLPDRSTLNGAFFSLTSRTIRPRWRSCSVTAAFDSASSSPALAAPATSIARKAKVLAPAIG